jgi:O-antigen/teichoic acid export membrane protein
MKAWPASRIRQELAGNVAARVGAMIALALATVIVARGDGPEGVGIYALLRVLPGLVGVLASAGLPGAVPFFLAGPHRDDSRLPLTIVSITVVAGVGGTLLWLAASPLLAHTFFGDLGTVLTAWAALTVLTQLLVAVAKGCCQGADDLNGANLIILGEELLFLPAYGVLHLAGIATGPKLVASLVLADVGTAAWGWVRLARRGMFRRLARPSKELTKEVAVYGARGQLGGLLSLLNLRLDFALLAAIAGPATLGVYAVASKFAEVVRVPTLALTYVLYPHFRREERSEAVRKARRLLPRAGLLSALAPLPLAALAGVLLPLLYGSDFRAAILPTCILLVGLAGEGIGAVASGFLYGAGHPGRNSLAMGAGVVITVVFDALLIPHHGAPGAAVASAIAYLTTTAVLLAFFLSSASERHEPAAETVTPTLEPAV